MIKSYVGDVDNVILLVLWLLGFYSLEHDDIHVEVRGVT